MKPASSELINLKNSLHNFKNTHILQNQVKIKVIHTFCTNAHKIRPNHNIQT